MHLSCALAAASAALLPAGREVCVDFWRHAGWIEVAFSQLAPPGVRARTGAICDAIACLKTNMGFVITVP
jgi:hypothetical protein